MVADPENRELRFKLARILSAKGNLADALAELAVFLQGSPADPEALYLLNALVQQSADPIAPDDTGTVDTEPSGTRTCGPSHHRADRVPPPSIRVSCCWTSSRSPSGSQASSQRPVGLGLMKVAVPHGRPGHESSTITPPVPSSIWRGPGCLASRADQTGAGAASDWLRAGWSAA